MLSKLLLMFYFFRKARVAAAHMEMRIFFVKT
jgi:hypothetical protein